MTQFLKVLVWTGAIAACLLAQNGNGNGNGNGKGSDKGKSGDTGNPGGSGDGPGQSGGNGNSSAPNIEWITPRADTSAELLDAGTSIVQFKSKVDLENVDVWLTPSLKGITADPVMFETIEKDTVYDITLTLEDPPAHTLGGTLHLKSGNKSLAQPLPINIKVKGETEDAEPVVSAVVSSTNYDGGSVTAGETVSLFGTGLGPQNGRSPELSNGRVADYLGDTQVLFNGTPAPVLSTSATQVNVVAPQAIAADSSVSITLTYRGKVAKTLTIPVTPASPALFTLDGSGQGQSAALNQNGTLNSSTNRAVRGSVVTFYGSGFGAWKTPVADGALIGAELPTPVSPVSVTIGGAAAKVLYAGGAPGLVSGVVQINAEIPATITSDDKVTVVVTVGSASSPATVTISVQ